jgi:predicted MFS family arabinose efflux permease
MPLVAPVMITTLPSSLRVMDAPRGLSPQARLPAAFVTALQERRLQNPTRIQQMLLFTALYAAQGLPYGFFTIALPALMRQAGLSLTMISFVSLLYWPWALKFLWAPYLDYLGQPRRWLLSFQLAGLATALVLAWIDWQSYWPLAVGAMFFNLIAASQDVVTDGLAVRTLQGRELGWGNGIQVGAYRLGMILGGSVLVSVFEATNWATMFTCMALLLALTVLPVLRMKPDVGQRSSPRPDMHRLAAQWLQRLMTPGVLTLLALIFCYRLGDAMFSQLLIPFVIDQKLSLGEVGMLKGVVGSTTSLLGALLGGWFAFRVRRRTLLLVAGLAQAVSFTPYLLAAAGMGGRELLWIATATEGLIGTVATVALFTLMMDGSDPEHAGTDYTLFASAVVGINALGGFFGGLIGDAFGYFVLFAFAILLCVLGCLVVVWWLDRYAHTGRIARAWGRAPAIAG